MIVMLRGNHGSGKSTAVRTFLKELKSAPIFGTLGPKMPEAYLCQGLKQPLYILGPYESTATCGCDYITKLGVAAMTVFLERYRLKGSILFESIMTSVRLMEPSIGKWVQANKGELTIVTLTTTMEQCEAAITVRKEASVAGTRWNNKHLVAQQRMFERVTSQYEERGFRMLYVTREEAPTRLAGLFNGTS